MSSRPATLPGRSERRRSPRAAPTTKVAAALTRNRNASSCWGFSPAAYAYLPKIGKVPNAALEASAIAEPLRNTARSRPPWCGRPADTSGTATGRKFFHAAAEASKHRPQRALDQQTPLAVFNSRIKARPLLQPARLDHRVRRDKIDSFGKVTLLYLGRLRDIPIGVAHKHRKVRP